MISAPATVLGRGHSIHAMTRTMRGREGTNYIKKTDHRWFSNSWKFFRSWQSRDKDSIVDTPTK